MARGCDGSGPITAILPARPPRRAARIGRIARRRSGACPRITGVRAGREPFLGEAVAPIERKEIVIENDIGWRIDAMVDYLFGKSLVVESTAPDPGRRESINRVIRAILAGSGGSLFFQQLSLLGAVYGFVDVLVKLDPAPAQQLHGSAAAGRDVGEPPALRACRRARAGGSA